MSGSHTGGSSQIETFFEQTYFGLKWIWDTTGFDDMLEAECQASLQEQNTHRKKSI